MSVENRDLVIERLERQLLEKDREIEEFKGSLRESILLEIRGELEKNLDLNNRVNRLENKLQELTNNMNGIMDELLDQKSLIRSLGNMKSGEKKNIPTPPSRPEPVPPKSPVQTARPQTPPAASMQPPVLDAPKPPSSQVKVETREASKSGVRFHARNSNFNIRDAEIPPSQKIEEEPEPDPESEYIIAESGDDRSSRLEKFRNQNKGSRAEYIVAEEPAASRKKVEGKTESVETRDDQDAVITITRRK